MACSLQELRKDAGYKTQQAFAEALGLSTVTVARYEADPANIPIKSAWAIAEKLHCTIDEVVGHSVSAGKAQSEEHGLERWYRGLEPESKKLFDEFIIFVAKKDEHIKRTEIQNRNPVAFQCYNYFITQYFIEAGHNKDIEDALMEDTKESRRSSFVSYVSAQLNNQGRSALLPTIMRIYDGYEHLTDDMDDYYEITDYLNRNY